MKIFDKEIYRDNRTFQGPILSFVGATHPGWFFAGCGIVGVILGVALA